MLNELQASKAALARAGTAAEAKALAHARSPRSFGIPYAVQCHLRFLSTVITCYVPCSSYDEQSILLSQSLKPPLWGKQAAGNRRAHREHTLYSALVRLIALLEYMGCSWSRR